MKNSNMDNSLLVETRAGIAGGLVGLLFTIQVSDIVQASVVAAVGAAVSFLVSLGLKRLFRKRKK
jgi:uncharacterized membrane protein